ncbi:MAG: hypothetical protein M1840_000595 [Geoglossum simile]|nr:MAG: hypothetical protein M1840_000595 [Geoglossum simile]
MLHSTFWTHGAGELNLPPWWTTILGGEGGYSGRLDNETERGRRSSSASALDGPLLDFLYPSTTLTLIRQFTSYGLDQWESRRSRLEGFNHRKRTYTSSAGGSCAGPELQTSELTQEEAYCTDIEDPDQPVLQVLERLSLSHQKTDAEKSVQLFHNVPLSERTATHYRLVVGAYLKLHDAQNALDRIVESSGRSMVDAGEHRVLAYAIREGLWDIGLEVWKLHFDGTDTTRQQNPRLWRLVRAIPNLWDQAQALAKYTAEEFELKDGTPEVAQALLLLKFTRSLVLGAILTRKIPANRGVIVPLFKALRPLKLRKGRICDRAIGNLLKSGSDVAAVELYKHIRTVEYTIPSQKTLHSILDVFCTWRSTRDIQMLLDDWSRYYTGPTQGAYRMAMAAFAALGNAHMVHRTFKLYLSRFRRPKTVDILTPLLSVHASRGDVRETANQFKRISSHFNLKPDITCWNILLHAYTNQDDVEGIQQCFDEMMRSGVKPDDYTIGTIMGFCANRGDIEGTEDMYRLSESLSLRKSTAMVNSLVLAYINDNQLGRAEQLAEKSTTMNLQGSPTRMWNSILVAFASRRDRSGIVRTLHRMKSEGVPTDGMTYSALMQFLVNIKRTTAAYTILKEIFPRNGMRDTAFHYSIVMEGFSREGDLHSVFMVLDRMREHKIKLALTTQIVLIKATASAEYQRWSLGHKPPQLAGAEKILGEALLNTGAEELATEGPIKGIKGQLRPAVYPAVFFDFLIFLYGREGYSEKALDLYDRCLSVASKEMRGYPKIPHTIKLIAALMVTHLQGRRYDEVSKYWNLAVKIAWEQARPWNPTEGSAPKQLPSPRKYLLATPFRYYAKSLSEQGKVDELIKEVERLNHSGFELERCSMNTYIQLLAVNNRTLLAFELCETHLMRDWSSWKVRSSQMKPNNEGIPALLGARPMRASYLTISRLSSAISKSARWVRMGSQDAVETLATIPKSYPKSMDAIRTLRREGRSTQSRLT